ncbi:GNAT family N-acetyltransferase [Streptomyces xinghaiensis]|uniref:GNAT family N-acetyltransferase n=1 Tax=Streptomyces xinghaiensis TaxID=1038928 RepID=UPI0037B9137C
MTRIETERLVLRRWRAEDLAPMAAVNSDPEVMRWIGDGSVRTERQTAESIAAWEREWEAEGFGLFAVELRETGELAGFTGLSVPCFLPEALPAVEIGWRLGRPFWGRGLATEAVRAVLDFGRARPELPRIVSVVQTGNRASERVVHKLGIPLERETVVPSSGRRARVYAVPTAEE